MLKKEILDSLKRLAESLLLFLTIPFTIFVDRVFIKFGAELTDVFYIIFYFIVTFFSIYSGATIFKTEKKDKAFEYLFSLPLSRLKILLYKILPRLVLLGVVILVYYIFSEPAITLPALFHPAVYLKKLNYLLTYFSFLFFLSAMLSLAFNSVALCLFGVFALNILRLYMSRSFDYLTWTIFPKLSGKIIVVYLNDFLSAFVCLIPIGVAFWITYKNMDTRPLKFQMKKYYVITISTIVVLIAYVLVFFNLAHQWFYG